MKAFGVLIALMLMFSLNFAWDSSVSVPSCLTPYSVLGKNFSVYDNLTAYSCATNATLPLGQIHYGNINNGYIVNYNSTHMRMYADKSGSGGDAYYTLSYIGVPQNNISITSVLGSGSPSYDIDCYNGGAWSVLADGSTTTQIVDYNSTDMKFISSTGSTTNNTYCKKSDFLRINLGVQSSGTATVYFPKNWMVNNFYGFTSDSILGAWTSSVAYTSYNAMAGAGVYSDFKTSNTMIQANSTTFCKALIYFNSQLLVPKMTYFPDVNAFANFYNTSNNVAYIMNNTVSYIVDSSGSWYTVLPFTCADAATIYSVPAYVYVSPTGSSGTGSYTLPSMYLIQNCYVNGSNWNWDVKGTSSKTYYFAKYYSGVIDTATFTGVEYTGVTNLTNATNITITDGIYPICGWNNKNTTFFSPPAFVANDNLSKIFGEFFIIVLLGISVFVPFMVLGVAAINDVFSIFSVGNMFTLAVSSVAISFLVNAFHDKNLKNIGFYFTIALAVAGYYATLPLSLGINNTDTTCYPTFITPSGAPAAAVQANLNSIINTIAPPDGSGIGWQSFTLLYTVPAFMVSLFNFVMSIPISIYSGIFLPLQCINPNLASAAVGMSSVITLGIALMLVAKAFEVAANRYRGV